MFDDETQSLERGGYPTLALGHSSAVPGYASLAAVWVVWIVVLSRPLWGDASPDDGRGMSTGEALRQAASRAERWLPFDGAGLVAGAAVGLALVRVGQRAARGRWVGAAAVLWVVCMTANCVWLVTHLFVICLPALHLFGILMDIQVAG